MLEAIEHVLASERRHCAVPCGGTNSTLAAGLTAAKLQQKVSYVEAGLRGFNREMPEEVSRVLADHVFDLPSCPTTAAVENTGAEGIS
jgi:UDP-GlcNAc3NAcA epimerase